MPRHFFTLICALRRIVAVAPILLLGMAYGGDAIAHGVTLHLQHAQSATSAVITKFIEPWVNKVHSDAGGRISLHVDPAVDEGSDLFQSVQSRKADVVWMDLTHPAELFPRIGVFAAALPGNTCEGSSRAVWTLVEMSDLGFREFKEMRVVAASRRGAPLFHLRDKTPASLAEFKGARIAVPNADGEAFLKALGLSATIMSVTDMRNALTNASIDGVMLSWNSLHNYGLDKLVSTHVNPPDGAVWAFAELSVLLMNPDAYRSMTDDLKQVIRANSGMDASAWLGKIFDEQATHAREHALARGERITTLPGADAGAWEQAARAATDQRVKSLDERGLNGSKMVAGARKLIEENDRK